LRLSLLATAPLPVFTFCAAAETNVYKYVALPNGPTRSLAAKLPTSAAAELTASTMRSIGGWMPARHSASSQGPRSGRCYRLGSSRGSWRGIGNDAAEAYRAGAMAEEANGEQEPAATLQRTERREPIRFRLRDGQ
jgi:hypothetical protein